MLNYQIKMKTVKYGHVKTSDKKAKLPRFRRPHDTIIIKELEMNMRVHNRYKILQICISEEELNKNFSTD